MKIGEMLTKFERGVSYHLRHNHPVIDAIGLLKEQIRQSVTLSVYKPLCQGMPVTLLRLKIYVEKLTAKN